MDNRTTKKNKDNDPSKVKVAWEEMLLELRGEKEKFKESIKEIGELYKDKDDLVNSITEVIKSNGIELSKSKEDPISRFLFGDQEKQKSQLKVFGEIAQKRLEIVSKMETPEEQSMATFMFDHSMEVQKQLSNTKDDDGLAGDLLGDAQNQLVNGLSNMMTDFDNFGKNFKKLGQDIANQMIKTSADALLKIIINEQSAAQVIQALRATWQFAGGLIGYGAGSLGSVGGFLSSIFKKRHSGGVIPSGGNYSLPGTDEQLALLKGGERVLSPGENVEYERNSGQTPVIFNNFNVRAWDAKDVKNYLLENKDLLNSITASGIKNNSQQLRHMVRNA